MRLPAYPCRPSPVVLPGVRVCVRCYIQRPAFKFGHVFFYPRAEQTGLSGEKNENFIFYDHKKPLEVTEGSRCEVVEGEL